MRIYLAGIVLIGMLSAGCSSDWDPARAGHAAEESGTTAAKTLPTASLSSRRGTTAFASLPDRGELLRYSPDRKVKRAGAYTSHPVDISEAHALNAIASGELRLNAPDGKAVAVPFDHIEEHQDGNWTWVGDNGNGDHAVLTFGEKAVFGEITSGGQSFRVTTRNGGTWLVETDHAMLAGTNRGQPEQGPDFLLPPTTTTGQGVAMAGSKAMAAAASGATQKAASVVDVALGYTNGLVTKYGSDSAAVSRITSFVALTNADYQRSGIAMRIRLVKTLLVNYADNNSNRDALQKLTGYNVDTGQPTTPDPAFNGLRAARDEFGADLVSLVRPHRSPEQDGCGIAWLLGAGQSAIDSADAPFGYSVVSEGDDIDETDNFTYFCSDHSLAHELGHSLGQAHNQADAEYAGAHAYSYGYRETSTTGFHTIMAYPLTDSSQFEIAYFANPAVNYSGRSTGVANVSDNARSMDLTGPIVATFRNTVVNTFIDVPNNYWAYADIQKIYELGITGGCSQTLPLYCPNDAVGRDQMAVFLLKAQYGSSYQPPAPVGVFADVPTTYWAASWIERVRALGITGGCSATPLLYCPTAKVTRDQMAVLLLKTKYGGTYQPPAATGMFQDVPTSHWAAPWIEQLAREGVTGGCATNPTRYCPNDQVKRDQMAVFLVRNFDL